MTAPADYSPRVGDRVLLKATVKAVRVRPGDDARVVAEVDIDDCCRAHIAPDRVHTIISQTIRAGDEVTWDGQVTASPNYGTVLYVEPAESVMANPDASPGQARALIKPKGRLDRPMIEVHLLTRTGGSTA